MSTPHQIWLVRHGETEWSANGRHTGRTDLPLTADGVREAAQLFPMLDRHQFGLVLTSPLARARETTRLAGFAGRALVEPDLLEWDYGEYEGLTTLQIRERAPGWTVFTQPCPGGETADEVEARVGRVVARCDASDGDALLFAHGHVLRVLTAVALGLGARGGARFALNTATINTIGWEREDRTLRSWNLPTSR